MIIFAIVDVADRRRLARDLPIERGDAGDGGAVPQAMEGGLVEGGIERRRVGGKPGVDDLGVAHGTG